MSYERDSHLIVNALRAAKARRALPTRAGRTACIVTNPFPPDLRERMLVLIERVPKLRQLYEHGDCQLLRYQGAWALYKSEADVYCLIPDAAAADLCIARMVTRLAKEERRPSIDYDPDDGRWFITLTNRFEDDAPTLLAALIDATEAAVGAKENKQ